MPNYTLKFFALIIFIFPSLSYSCGDNPNAIIQGPFEDNSFRNGYICFQNTSDKREIEFHHSYTTNDGVRDYVADTFSYSDAPAELMSVFFASVGKRRNVIVLLRWNVNYENKGIQYPYYYEIKSYQNNDGRGYELNLSSEKDTQLSGYQIKKDGKVVNYRLDSAKKIKQYLIEKYSSSQLTGK